MRIVENFNQNWLFTPEKAPLEAPDDAFNPVTLPHTNKLFNEIFVDNRDYQFVSTYRKHFAVADELLEKRVFIDFDGAMLMSAVHINGELVGIHKGGYTPFSYEITDYLSAGDNTITVYVDATEHSDIPPYGDRVDYLTFGGIYRDVYLRVLDPCHITDFIARPVDVLDQPKLDCEIHLAQVGPDMQVKLSLADGDGKILAESTHPVTSDIVAVTWDQLGDIELWTLECPVLYQVSATLEMGGKPLDRHAMRMGFRQAEFCSDGKFYLNGDVLQLFGLNRHQTYPFIGAAAPARLQVLDADILKNELGCNIVRTSHYAQSPYFLDRCDEIGLLVFEELAGWQHLGDEAWQALVLDDLQAMIERDRHHPSIVLWGTRVNESPDNEAFYSRTTALAHELDPTRQTGGVRNFIESQFLEDVFTLNDFPEGIQTPRFRPHLITEFAGHMFPTKTWDHEARRIEHALLHARKHNLQYGHPDVAGAIGWCAFDYHTHQDFGSGDRVCYHGVMDIYRLPKMAGYFYRSQKSPADEIVLYPATNWTLGDRDTGGNNPLTIFSNCDEIEILIGDESFGCYQPDRESFPHLKHPPFTVRWAEPYNPWGIEFLDLTVRGFIDGEQIAEHKIDARHLPDRLLLTCHTSSLIADGADVARLAVQVVDKYGNVLPYQMPVVQFEIEGDAEIIGENPMALRGGQGAIFIKSTHHTGKVVIHARTQRLPSASIELDITSANR